jgi:glycosyltransferase involved in cell wall biosynthesis
LIPTHNRGQILGQTLESLGHLQFPSDVAVEVVVVGNACTDNTEHIAREAFAKLPFDSRYVTESRANLNVARNVAVNSSRHDICALLDDDVWVEPGWLISLVEAYRISTVDIVAGRISLWWKDVARPSWFTPNHDSLLTSKDYGDAFKRMFSPYDAAGANFSFRRRVYETIGPFTEGLDRTGADVGLSAGESEFIQRAIDAGFEMYYAPEVKVKHWVSPQRIDLAYLERVAFANGASRVLIKPRLGPYTLFRCAAGNLGVYLLHQIGAVAYASRGNAAKGTLSKIKVATARGAGYGLWLRLTGRSPMNKRMAAEAFDVESAKRAMTGTDRASHNAQ